MGILGLGNVSRYFSFFKNRRRKKVAILGLPSLPGAVPLIYIALLASFEIISAKERNTTSKWTGSKGENFIE